ncbi:unnamed protein product [Brassica rapa subsp. narinosa]
MYRDDEENKSRNHGKLHQMMYLSMTLKRQTKEFFFLRTNWWCLPLWIWLPYVFSKRRKKRNLKNLSIWQILESLSLLGVRNVTVNILGTNKEIYINKKPLRRKECRSWHARFTKNFQADMAADT